MTNYAKWSSYDVNNELMNMINRDGIDEILVPYKRMIRNIDSMETEIKTELSKFTKSMKSLSGVAKLKLKSKLQGGGSAASEAQKSVDLLTELSTELLSLDKMYNQRVCSKFASYYADVTKPVLTPVYTSMNANSPDNGKNLVQSGIILFTSLIEFSNKTKDCLALVQENFKSISLILNMNESLITTILQKLWVLCDCIVSQVITSLAYAAYSCGNIPLSLEVSRFYLRKYSSTVQTGNTATANASDEESDGTPAIISELIKKTVGSEGMQINHAFVWSIRCISLLEIGCPYLARVHGNCMKRLVCKSTDTSPSAEEANARAAAAMYGMDPSAIPAGGLMPNTMYLVPNLSNMVDILDKVELDYAMRTMKTMGRIPLGTDSKVPLHPDESAFYIECMMFCNRVASSLSVTTHIPLAGKEGGIPVTPIVLGDFVNAMHLADVVNRIYYNSESGGENEHAVQTSDFQPSVESVREAFVTSNKCNYRAMGGVEGAANDDSSSYRKSACDKDSIDTGDDVNCDYQDYAIESVLYKKLLDIAVTVGSRNNLDGKPKEHVLQWCLTWYRKVYYEAQLLFLESFFHAAQLKYYLVIALINISLSIQLDATGAIARDPMEYPFCQHVYYCSILNISTCLMHRKQSLYGMKCKPHGACDVHVGCGLHQIITGSSSLNSSIDSPVDNNSGNSPVLEQEIKDNALIRPIHVLINMNALNLSDAAINYVNSIQQVTPPVVWVMYHLTCMWRKCLILEQMHEYEECLTTVEAMAASITDCSEQLNASQDVLNEKIDLESVSISMNEATMSNLINNRYGSMFTQEFITLGAQMSSLWGECKGDCDPNDSSCKHNDVVSLAMEDIYPLPGFNRDLKIHEEYYSTTNCDVAGASSHTENLPKNKRVLMETLNQFKIGIENKMNRLRYVLRI